MSGSVLVAVAAAVGNFLQGWDNATIAGSFILSLLFFPLFQGKIIEVVSFLISSIMVFLNLYPKLLKNMTPSLLQELSCTLKRNSILKVAPL